MIWLVVVASYLAGAVPFAHLAARRLAGVDVRRAGSGNVGATNVLRLAGAPLAGLVLLLDAGKGAAAVLAARALGADEGGQAAAGAAAVVGHVWPVWLGFCGGKGVAVAGGAFAVLAPAATAMAAALFTVVVAISRYVSLGSLAAAAAQPLLVLVAGGSAATAATAAAVAVLIAARHRANLGRLRSGTEWRLVRRRRDGGSGVGAWSNE
ncbi:MAG: glycerol-3-phosphate 1-O-acyltransferase PlsY [Acidobacteria bacterium]|nr:glycerol-3-phosphate 1-O-acyltransferase PlsY [Acidobacteriota bacterium]